jgi:phage tail tape-measure protein
MSVGVGTVVGAAVGTVVGAAVGTVVGAAVGTSVGVKVGTSVGVKVGTVVGTGVGNGVGTGEGLLEGRGVATTLPAVNVVMPVTTIASHCVTSAVVTLFALCEVRRYALNTVGGFLVASLYTLALSFAACVTT